jgi:hypothetical protein
MRGPTCKDFYYKNPADPLAGGVPLNSRPAFSDAYPTWGF